MRSYDMQGLDLGQPFIGFSRYPVHGHPSLEVSSKGDSRFSALFARLEDGRSVEQAFQLVKGYRAHGDDWRLGKGKPPLFAIDLWGGYKDLWKTFLDQRPDLYLEIRRLGRNTFLTDMFASGPTSQARALAEIVSERTGWVLREATGHSAKLRQATGMSQTSLFDDAAPSRRSPGP